MAMRMKPEVKAKWIEALRSGEYQQAQNSLKADIYSNYEYDPEVIGQGYCCLGVLCDLYRKEVKADFWNDYTDEERETDQVPNEVVEWADINNDNLATPEKQAIDEYNISQQFLATKNDAGLTFKEISDAIENFVGDSADPLETLP